MKNFPWDLWPIQILIIDLVVSFIITTTDTIKIFILRSTSNQGCHWWAFPIIPSSALSHQQSPKQDQKNLKIIIGCHFLFIWSDVDSTLWILIPICRTWVATSTALVLAIIHTLVCLLHNTTPGIDFSSSHKVTKRILQPRWWLDVKENHLFSLFVAQLIDQWKQIAANLVILVATNLVGTIHTISLLLLISGIVLLIWFLTQVGLFIHNLTEEGQRRAFLDTRDCIAARLEMEDENEKLERWVVDIVVSPSHRFFSPGSCSRCCPNTWPLRWKAI